jgi:drug/metabolite transporter (DMT)-like permease
MLPFHPSGHAPHPPRVPMPHSDPPRHRGPIALLLDQPYLLLVLAPLFWGGNVVAAKLVVGEVDAYLLLAARCVGATTLIGCLAWRDLTADWLVIRRTWPLLMSYGVIGYALFNVLLYLGVTYTTAVNSSIVQAALPVMILGANFLVFRVRTRPVQIIGVAIAIFGVIVTATEGQPLRILTLDINIGDGLVIIACLSYTAYTLALKYRPEVRMMSFLAVAFCGAMLFSLVLLQVFGGGLGQFATLATASPTAWAVILYVAVLPSLFSQIFYARGVELVGPNRAALTHNLIPLFGTLGSVLILGERFQLFHAVAAAVIILGIVLAEWSARRL